MVTRVAEGLLEAVAFKWSSSSQLAMTAATGVGNGDDVADGVIDVDGVCEHVDGADNPAVSHAPAHGQAMGAAEPTGQKKLMGQISVPAAGSLQ